MHASPGNSLIGDASTLLGRFYEIVRGGVQGFHHYLCVSVYADTHAYPLDVL